MGQFVRLLASQTANKQLLGAGLCSPARGRPEDQQKEVLASIQSIALMNRALLICTGASGSASIQFTRGLKQCPVSN